MKGLRIFLKANTPKPVLILYRAYKLHKTKATIIQYLKSVPKEECSVDQNQILRYLKHHPLSIFPYAYTKKYESENVMVYEDNDKEMDYVLQEGMRLYFKRGWDEKRIKAYYNNLLMEQDIESPHRYETSDFYVRDGDVVVDVGVAEGNFALSVVNRAKKLYLFETDETWIEALKATFEPWKDKVEIVNKYVSDNDNDNNITLDNFLKNEKLDFIKADIEGAEPQLVAGATNILSTQAPLKIVLCTYHRHNDAEVLNQMLTGNGFQTEFSKGYMIFLLDKFSSPYLRRGLIRATKTA